MNDTETRNGTAYEYGYARVSTTSQDLARQLDALNKAGIPDERIYADKKSGKSADAREGLQRLISRDSGVARPGDVIVVYTLDRLGRNMRETMNIIHDLTERGIYLRSIADPLPIDTAKNDAMSHVATLMLQLFAEMERVYTNERAAHARSVRRANGQRVGRKKAHAEKDIDYARRLRRDDGLSYSKISERTGIPVGSLYRYLNSDTEDATEAEEAQ